MEHKFPVTITALGKQIFEGDAEMVVLPGETGVLDVLAGHENTFEHLKEGKMKIVTGDGQITYQIRQGDALISKDKEHEFHVSIFVEDPKFLSEEGSVTRREQER
jgi:F0F1-type ATP synthase epsilon subunit